MTSGGIYQPLNRDCNEVRVLRLFGLGEDGLLHGELEVVSLLADTRPNYEAISYCWGEISGRGCMLLNDIVFEAPASAIKVLKQFRPKEFSRQEPRILWIDAVCINQSDIEERGHQVGIMGQVFQSCQQALIWLGDSDGDVPKAVWSIELASREARARTGDYRTYHEAINEPWNPSVDPSYSQDLLAAGFDFYSLDAFLGRPWFRRVWVLQESVLSPTAMCYCGAFGVSLLYLCMAVKWLTNRHRSIVYRANERLAVGWRFAHTASHLLIFGRTHLERPSIKHLSGLLWTVPRLECTEPLDRVYAILGLTNWSPGDPRWPKDLVVDYNASAGKVFALATKVCIRTRNDLEILRLTDINQRTSFLESGFPSWVPSLEGLEHVHPYSTFNPDNKIALERPIQVPYEPYDHLIVEGYEFDSVALAVPMSDTGTPEDFRMISKAAVRTISIALQARSQLNDGIGDVVALTLVAGGKRNRVGPFGIDGPANRDDLLQDLYRSFNDQGDYNASYIGQKQFDFGSLARGMCRNRAIFLTERGYVGSGPALTHPGDIAAILFGHTEIAILRRKMVECQNADLQQDGERVGSNEFLYLGGSYIHGIMDGEAAREFQASGKEISVFDIA